MEITPRAQNIIYKILKIYPEFIESLQREMINGGIAFLSHLPTTLSRYASDIFGSVETYKAERNNRKNFLLNRNRNISTDLWSFCPCEIDWEFLFDNSQAI